MRDDGPRPTRRGSRDVTRSPLSGPAIFGLVYTLYFGFGAINFVPRRGIVGMNVVIIILAGLLAFGAGVWLRSLLAGADANRAPRPVSELRDVDGWRPLALIFGVLGVCAAIGIVIAFEGIPLFAGERRNQISAVLVGILFALYLCVSITGGHALFRRRWPLLASCVVGVSLLIFLGYRSFILIPIGAIFFTARNLGLIHFKPKWVVLGALFAVGLSWLGLYRFDAGKDSILRQFLVLGWQEKYTAFIPIWATPREGTSVFALLVESFPSTWDFERGGMFASMFTALLPGKQLGPRLEVAGYIGGRPGQSITPSILGQPYVDFGVLGVLVFMFVLGFVLKWLWIWQASSLTWAPRVASGFVLTVLLLDIHAGLLDAQVILGAAFMVWWAARAEGQAKRHAEPPGPGARAGMSAERASAGAHSNPGRHTG